MSELDPVLQRWLKTMEMSDAGGPSKPAWDKFLKRIDGHLRHLQDDRDLLTRTLEMSTSEMNALHDQVRSQRDALERVVKTAAEGLSVFHDLAGRAHKSPAELADAMTLARVSFAKKMAEVAGEDEDLDMGTSTGSIRGLQQSFTVLSDRLTDLIQETSNAASLRKQLEVAGAVQAMLVPESPDFWLLNTQISAWFQPAAECGGDWWAAEMFDEDSIVVAVGDVTGHGIPSALITATVKGAFDLIRTLGKGRIGPAQMLRLLNPVIFATARQQYLMSFILAVYQPSTGLMRYANAGHPAPCLRRGREVSVLRGHREAPLGADPDTSYHESEVTLKPGDMLALFTDGVTEAESEVGEQFSERRLRALLATSPTSSTGMRDALRAAIEGHCGAAPLDDDITAVLLTA